MRCYKHSTLLGLDIGWYIAATGPMIILALQLNMHYFSLSNRSITQSHIYVCVQLYSNVTNTDTLKYILFKLFHDLGTCVNVSGF